MKTREEMKEYLSGAAFRERMQQVYGCNAEEAQKYVARFVHITEGFAETFENNRNEIGLYSAPGRTEIGGNHTDHQLGCVLAGSVNLDIIAAAALNGTKEIRFFSEGYGMTVIDLKELEPKEDEKETTAALIRGMAALAAEQGYAIDGFDVYSMSSVLGGSGLSSSAAFETLTGVILNDLFCKNAFNAVQIAQMGQKAENVFFGKPCGLMDQMASSVGGFVAIDFAKKDAPVIEKVPFDFAATGHALCIIDSRSSHDDLTEDYAAIPREMKKVAAFFGKEQLRGVEIDELLDNAKGIRESCGDRAFLRAVHFVKENVRAGKEAEAGRQNDFAAFLKLVRESGYSSYMYLQNTAVSGSIENQAVNSALALADLLLDGKGAFRVHGGGFAGTIQAFVPVEMLDTFKRRIEAALGEGSCHVLTIRPVGGAVIA